MKPPRPWAHPFADLVWFDVYTAGGKYLGLLVNYDDVDAFLARHPLTAFLIVKREGGHEGGRAAARWMASSAVDSSGRVCSIHWYKIEKGGVS